MSPTTNEASQDETGTGVGRDKMPVEVTQKIPDVSKETSQTTEPLPQSLSAGDNSVWTGQLRDRKS